MNRREFLKAIGIGAAYIAVPGCSNIIKSPGSKNLAARPNIILIMVDDMGYSDIGCYGGEIRTPNLDKLAQNGLRFTQFYNTARCSPSRASLMTGLYPHQADMGWLADEDLGREGYHNEINNKCVTIAEVLKQAGYGTYMSGKWHLTSPVHFEGPKDSWPCQRGFDRFFGTLVGAGSFYKPESLTLDNNSIEPWDGFYYTNAISDYAVKFIKEHNQNHPDKPYFVYAAYTAPHWPLHALKEDIDRYKGKYMKGWDILRQERYERMIEIGIIEPKWPLSPREKILKPWADVPQRRKDEMDLRMAIYAAMIDRVDQGIGHIVETAKKTGQLDNTLILFLSDNGGCHEDGLWGFGGDEGIMGEDSSWASYGRSWANASNTPFRMYKSWVHEGGISTPLIAHWPKGIKYKGSLCHQPGHIIDIMPTCCEVAGAAYPSTYKGNEIWPVEGASLVPASKVKRIGRKEPIYWEHEGNRAVRDGKWKLVAKGADGPWELYDLEADRTETRDLSRDHPDLHAKMIGMYDAWAQRCGVLPWPVRRKPGFEPPERDYPKTWKDLGI